MKSRWASCWRAWSSNGVSRNGDGALPAAAFAPSARGRAARPRYDDIPGLVYSEMGMQRRTGPRALLKELDTLPLAAWDLIDVERYRAFWRSATATSR